MYFVAALGLLAGSFYSFFSTRAFVASAVSASGGVIELEEGTGAEGRDTYAPRVRFQTEDGKTYEFTSHVTSDRGTYHIGEDVQVLFNPQDPSDARIRTFLQVWGFTIGFAGVGVVLGVLGRRELLASRRGANESAKPPAPDGPAPAS